MKQKESTDKKEVALATIADKLTGAEVEIQNLRRELEIEAALERVRAASMAMHQSKDLYQVINVVYNQLADLGLTLHSAQILDTLNDQHALHVWNAGKEQVYPEQVHIPSTRNVFFTRFYAALKNNESFYTLLLSKQQKDDVFEHYFKNAKNVDVPKSRQDFIYSSPGMAMSVAIGKDAVLSLCRFDASPYPSAENEILRRFGKVFDQSYTRFLDLQKAEAQTREAQIEAALERVRSASMAMHQSKDLHQVINVVYNQLADLGLTLHSAQILDTLNDQHALHLWNAGKDQVYPEQVHIPSTKNVFFTRFYAALKNNESFYALLLSKQQKDDVFEHYFKNAKNVDVPKSRQDVIYSSPGMAMSVAIGKDAVLSLCRFDASPYPPAENEVLKRFGKVFDQSYTRFLDLKKAEAQAREAQIEASLERLRSASLAIHRSEELHKVVLTVSQEIKSLGLKIDAAHIYRFVEGDKGVHMWIAGDGGIYPYEVYLPYIKHEIFDAINDARTKHKNFYAIPVVNKREFNRLYHHLVKSTKIEIPEDRQKFVLDVKSASWSIALGKHSGIGLLQFSEEESGFSLEENEILKRLSKVFEQAFTRFLDLQKAEAQAREAQIEASLERVRAKTMAMHRSKDLREVIAIVYQQLYTLDFIIDSCLFNLFVEASDDLSLWIATPEIQYPEEVSVPYFKHPVFDEIKKAKQGSKSFMVLSVGRAEKDALYSHFYENSAIGKMVNAKRKKAIAQADGIEYSFTISQHHSLSIGNFRKHQYTAGENNTIARFSQVFEQTYTRFLDLQKAESQTREAEIEAAMERVRSRSMAMHQSEELHEVITTVFEQLKNLGVGLDSCLIHIFQKEDKEYHWWAAATGQKYSRLVKLPIIDHPFFLRFNHAHDKEELIFSDLLSKKEKNSFFEYLYLNMDDVVPKERKKFIEDKAGVARSVAFMHHTAFIMMNYDAIPFSLEENEILLRFANVFEQVYTRFLDLQKAEAQAREAQIEAALQRVRAASMAMHSSEGLAGVAAVLRAQLALLGQKQLESCLLQLYDKGSDTYTAYYTYKKPKSTSEEFVQDRAIVPWKETAWSRTVIEKYLAGEAHFSIHADKEMLREWYRMLVKVSPRTIQRNAKGKLIVPEELFYDFASFSGGFLSVVAYKEPSQETRELLDRAATTFDIAYRRYLDLKKAEAQARESQIEACLERIRAAAMAMHNSKDIAVVTDVLHEQLANMGQKELESSLIHLYPEDLQSWEAWWIYQPQGSASTKKVMGKSIVSRDRCLFSKKALKNYGLSEDSYTIKSEGKMLVEWYEVLEELASDTLDYDERGKLIIPKVLYYHFSKFSGGALLMVSNEEPVARARDLHMRAARVFGLAYTRFLDLQKAEAQAREAQIEAALERIRASAMAMHKTEELINVVRVLRQQMGEMGETQLESIVIHLYQDGSQTFDGWFGYRHKDNPDGEVVEGHCIIEWDKTERARQDQKKYYSSKKNYTIIGDRAFLREWYLYLEKAEPRAVEYDNIGKLIIPDLLFYNYSKFENGALLLITNKEATEQSKYLLRRAADVFNLAYTRFLDLKKAEAQAREAQIEVSLERVRAASLAMHNSSELVTVSHTLREQLEALGVEEIESVVIVTYDIAQNQMIGSYVYRNPENPAAPLQDGRSVFDWDATARARSDKKHYFSKDTDYSIKADYEILLEWYQYLEKTAPNSVDYDEHGKLIVPEYLFYNYSKFRGGALLLITSEQADAESTYILKRAAKVFDMAYQRFMDLQKAEAQTQEAQIEACLERIRAEAMAMHESKDLGKVVSVVFEELKRLDLGIMRCGIGLINGSNQTVQVWITSTTAQTDQALQISGAEPLSGHPLLEGIFNHWMAQKPFMYVLEGKDLIDYYRAVADTGFQEPVASAVLGAPQTKHFYHCVMFPAGGLFVFKDAPIGEETLQILHRFTDAFHLAYTRFEDLQKSEARAKAAIKEASLDRVRAEIASMRTSADLETITPLIWKELTVLDVPFFRCGVFIVDEELQSVQVFLTTPNGDSQTSMLLPFGSSEVLIATIDYWRNKKIFKEQWTKERFIAWTNSVVAEGYVKKSDDYHMRQAPDRIALHFLPFSQGMLYIGSDEALADDKLEVAQSLADTFSVAYARYEDFQHLEEAKARIEGTLKELQATQAQLIQSEKMASLGELTAGIAHEIQNPLNFVNNFSEVSTELIEEARMELEKGDVAESKEILNDLIQNLQKIRHHGQRASSIVKGMLDHSRTSSGEKVPTDINTLCDEYLRLAYHGLRARNKNFNAKYETNFQEDLPQINIIPQDIGRVILNLVNNAFHACTERSRSTATNNLTDFVEPMQASNLSDLTEKSIAEDRGLSELSGQSDAENLTDFKPLVLVSTKLSPRSSVAGSAGGGKVAAGQSLKAPDGVESIQITISDNGPGIPEEIKDKIFQPFFTTKPTGQGTGLGLSLSYDIVKVHGGELMLESAEGIGSSFIIRLPLV